MEASGQINRRGIVDLAFRRMGKVAHVTGRLADGSARAPGRYRPCSALVSGTPSDIAEVTGRAEARRLRFPSHMNAFQRNFAVVMLNIAKILF